MRRNALYDAPFQRFWRESVGTTWFIPSHPGFSPIIIRHKAFRAIVVPAHPDENRLIS